MPVIKSLVYDRLHPDIVGQLEGLGISVVYSPNMDKQEFEKAIADVDIIIGRTKFSINQEIINLGQNLKAIVRAGAGLDDIDLDYAHTKGIHVINAPEGNAPAVGGHAVALLLNLLHKINSSFQEIKSGFWNREENRTTELGSLTVGIIGYGNNGAAFANCLSGFGCKILAYDKYKSGFGNEFVKEVNLEEIINESDVISLHVPLTAETRHLVDSEFVYNMKKQFILLNVCRGAVVNTRALIDGIKSKKILAAGLDVLEEENYFKKNEEVRQLFSELTGRPNIAITPHIAGLSNQSYQRINKVITQKLSNLLPLIATKTKIIS
jgi:D-3-phosphoglycerate dehydrogenase